jgi:hypothetical protein
MATEEEPIKEISGENPDYPKFRLVIEYQPTPEATSADMEMYMAGVMDAVKHVPGKNVELIQATIQRED